MNFDEILEHHILDHRIAKVLSIGGHDLYFTTHVLMMLISAAIVFAIGLASRQYTERADITGAAAPKQAPPGKRLRPMRNP